MKERGDGFRIPLGVSGILHLGMLHSHVIRSTDVKNPPRISAIHYLRIQQPRRSRRCNGQPAHATHLSALVGTFHTRCTVAGSSKDTVARHPTDRFIAQQGERIKSAFLAQGWSDQMGDVNRLLGWIGSVNQIQQNT